MSDYEKNYDGYTPESLETQEQSKEEKQTNENIFSSTQYENPQYNKPQYAAQETVSNENPANTYSNPKPSYYTQNTNYIHTSSERANEYGTGTESSIPYSSPHNPQINNTQQPSYTYGDNYKTTSVLQQNTVGQGYTYANAYSAPNNNPYGYGTASSQQAVQPYKPAVKKKKEKRGRGGIAAAMALCMLASGALGVGGGVVGYNLANSGVIPSGDGMTIQRVVNTINAADSDKSEMTTAKIVESTENSVVEITTEIVQTGKLTRQYIESGAGSGVIVSENGYIITNNHVIDGAEKVVVTLKDGTTYDATLIGRDSQVDVALLKIDAKGLTSAVFGDSDKVNVGEKTIAIGNPLGQLGGTVTEGIVSALNRDLVIGDVTMNLLQTSAAINPGNSGGGLFNSKGELIGLVVAKTVDTQVEGLGFAIPINHVSDILSDLKEHGYVTGRPQMGVQLVDVANRQTAMMYGVTEIGVYVSEVTGTEAQNAGFEMGDRITAVNGKKVSSIGEVKAELQKSKVGSTIKVDVDRSGKTTTLTLLLSEQTPAEKTTEPQAQNGFNQDGGYSDEYEYDSGSGNSIEDFFKNFF
ncbi:hypothetical protein AGMMS50284_3930 [Clostridia bacterium]|nr:hypothetical protein AGMMS50284_3930 [Clostridia bacterium]